MEVQCRVRTWNAGIGKLSRRLEVDLTSLAGPMMACGMQLEGEQPVPLELSRVGTRTTPPEAVEARDADLYFAVDQAAVKAGRRVARMLEQARASRTS